MSDDWRDQYSLLDVEDWFHARFPGYIQVKAVRWSSIQCFRVTYGALGNNALNGANIYSGNLKDFKSIRGNILHIGQI